jgi:hypothetical protein
MLDKEEFLNTFSKEFQLIEAYDYKASNIFMLNLETANDFMELAKNMQVSIVYYTFRYYYEEQFLIPLEEYDSYSDTIINEVKEHNELVEKLDFYRPAQLDLFLAVDGIVSKVIINDFWIDEMDVLRKEGKVQELEEQFEREFVKKEKEEAALRKLDEDRLREYILNDKEFTYKKNILLRQEYLQELLKKDEFNNLEYLFEGLYRKGISLSVQKFMDRLWIEHKENKKKKKDHSNE